MVEKIKQTQIDVAGLPIGYDIMVGSVSELTNDICTHLITTWAAAVSNNDKVLFLDGTHVPTADADITITETGVIIRMQSKAAEITTSTYSFSSTGDDCDIELNVSTGSNVNIRGVDSVGLINNIVQKGVNSYSHDYNMVIGSSSQVTAGIATHVITDMIDANISNNDTILILDGTHDPGTITITKTGLVVRSQSKNAVITTDDLLTFSGINCDIELNVSSPSNLTTSIDGGVAKINNGIRINNILISPYQGILRNVIINGDMRIAQRGTSLTGMTVPQYTLDQWKWVAVHSTDQVGWLQSSEVPADHPELQYSLRLDNEAICADPGAGEFGFIRNTIEGYNFAPFVGKSAILSFWVRATRTGVYCVSFVSKGSDLSLVSEYTVTTTNEWQLVNIPITFDYSSGTWDYTNDVGVYINFSLMCGATYQASAADTWEAGNFFGTSNQVNALESASNDFYITGVQLHLDTGSGEALPFDPRPYAEELRLCRRYYWRFAPGSSKVAMFAQGITTSTAFGILEFPTIMRAAPTALEQSGTAGHYGITTAAGTGQACTAAPGFNANTSKYKALIQLTSTSGFSAGNITYCYFINDLAYFGFSAEL